MKTKNKIKLAKLIKSATPAAIEAKRAAVAKIAAELSALENGCENERAKFARALYFKRIAALGRMEYAAKLSAISALNR